MPLDSKNWIDGQIAAGMGRGNIYVEILAAAKLKRAGAERLDADRAAAKERRIQSVRESAARVDELIDSEPRRRPYCP